MRAKHIGIAAVSAEGAALCYRTICNEGAALLGRGIGPELGEPGGDAADRHLLPGQGVKDGRHGGKK